jgi:predicted transposase YdaD
LRQFGLGLADIRLICTCKASAYYRALLDGKAEGEQPSIEEGRLVAKEEIPLVDMSPEEMLESAKDKAVWLGSKTKELG